MRQFSILHGSDLHVGAEPAVVHFYEVKGRMRPGLKRHLLHLTSHDPDLIEYFCMTAATQAAEGMLDAVVITGDIARSGDRDDLKCAKACVDPPVIKGWLAADGEPSLGGALGLPRSSSGDSVPVVLLPGNHDRYEGRRRMPGGAEFDRMFDRYWKGGKQGCDLLWKSSFPDNNLAIIGLDCSLEDSTAATGLTGYLGQGRVTHSSVERLKEVTSAVRSDQRSSAIVLALHFSPGHPAATERSSLLEEGELVSAMNQLGIQNILCGHHHAAHVYQTGAPAISCWSADSVSHCAESRNGFHSLRLDVVEDRVVGVVRVDHYWNVESGDWTTERSEVY